MLWAFGLLATVVARVAPAPAVPERPRPSSYELTWEAPTSCPDAAAIEQSIEALLPTVGDGGPMTVRAVVTDDAGSFSLRLTTEFLGVLDERDPIRSARCEDLAQSVALTVAITLDPGVADRSPGESLVGEPPPPVEPEASGDNPPPAHPIPESPSEPSPASGARGPEAQPDVAAPRKVLPSSISLQLAPLLTAGALPRVGGGTELGLSIAWPRARLGVFGQYLFPQRNRSESGLFQLGTAGVRGCGRLFAARVEFPLCAGAEAGAVRADSRGLPEPTTIQSLWVAGLAGAGVALRGKRIGLWTLAEASVPLVQPQFLVGDRIVFRSAPVTFRAIVGVEIFLR